VDTTNILFVCAGTFSDLYAARGEESSKRKLGFSGGFAGASHSGRDRNRGKGRKPIQEKHLIDCGFLSEFLGRLPVRVELDALSEDELVRVLAEPPDSLVREYQELLGTDDIELVFTKEALHVIVDVALSQHTGARGLRTAMETAVRDLMFDAPERRGERIVVKGDLVRERCRGLLEGSGDQGSG